MDAGFLRYVVGATAVLVAAAVLGTGAWRLRTAVLPAWRGAPARLAEAVVGLAALLLATQLAGAIGLLRPLPVLLAVLAAGAVLVAVGVRTARVDRPTVERAPRRRLRDLRRPGWEVAVATAAGAVVVVQWIAHTADAVLRGMTHPDTLWYHMPFVARFAQEGGFVTLDGLGYEAARWFPFNSQSLHALLVLAFGTDAFSPYLNLLWLGLAVLAGWCLGAERGVGHLTALGALVVAGLPILAATQPGQASSDIACAALLLAAVALLVQHPSATATNVVAGVALGLAIATKVTIAAPGGVLALGVLAVHLAHRRFRTGGGWLAGVAGAGSFWYLRNWVLAGSPLPWFELGLGPVSLPAIADQDGPSIVDDPGGREAWSSIYEPGLGVALSDAWPLLLALVAVAAVGALLRRGRPIEQVVGAAVVVGLVAHVFTPLTGGFSFVFNLRYLAAVLMIALAFLPRVVPSDAWARRVLLATYVVVLATAATAPHLERVVAWPPLETVLAVVVAMALAGVALAVALAPDRRVLQVGGALLLPLVLVAGWGAQTYYLRHRYVGADLHMDDVHTYFREVSDARVGVFGTDETYPMFGTDLSNDVRRADDVGWVEGEMTCEDWRRNLADQYDYIVLTRFGFGNYRRPAVEVIADDPATTEVVRDGESVAFRVDGALDAGDCPAGDGTSTAPS